MTATDTMVNCTHTVTGAANNHLMDQVALGGLSHCDAATGLPTPGVDLATGSRRDVDTMHG